MRGISAQMEEVNTHIRASGGAPVHTWIVEAVKKFSESFLILEAAVKDLKNIIKDPSKFYQVIGEVKKYMVNVRNISFSYTVTGILLAVNWRCTLVALKMLYNCNYRLLS